VARGNGATSVQDDLTIWHLDALTVSVAAATLREATTAALPQLLDLDPVPAGGDPLELVLAARDELETVPDELDNLPCSWAGCECTTPSRRSGLTMSGRPSRKPARSLMRQVPQPDDLHHRNRDLRRAPSPQERHPRRPQGQVDHVPVSLTFRRQTSPRSRCRQR
jgi:hypothetical protein